MHARKICETDVCQLILISMHVVNAGTFSTEPATWRGLLHCYADGRADSAAAADGWPSSTCRPVCPRPESKVPDHIPRPGDDISARSAWSACESRFPSSSRHYSTLFCQPVPGPCVSHANPKRRHPADSGWYAGYIAGHDSCIPRTSPTLNQSAARRLPVPAACVHSASRSRWICAESSPVHAATSLASTQSLDDRSLHASAEPLLLQPKPGHVWPANANAVHGTCKLI